MFPRNCEGDDYSLPYQFEDLSLRSRSEDQGHGVCEIPTGVESPKFKNDPRDLNFISLDPIIICPKSTKQPQVLNLQQTLKFPNYFARPQALKENETQTSKTLIELIENEEKLNNECKADDDSSIEITKLTTANTHNNKSYTMEDVGIKIRSKRCATPVHTKKVSIARPVSRKLVQRRCNHKTEILLSPKYKRCDDSIDLKNYNNYNNYNQMNDFNSINTSENSVCSENVTLSSIVDKLQDGGWEVSLDGLHDLLYIAPRVDWSQCDKEIAIIYRKLIDLFRSPRSTVCRITCQTSGELFRILKCTRRPEFDDIVDILLSKTSDANRFIQKDANVALDKMVTYISVFHSVRALCARGPTHKNHMVRTATVRLLICICAICGIDNVIGVNANKHTRKRILTSLAIFITDKNLDTRRFGERLCKMLRKHKFFQEYFYKDLEMNQKIVLKKIVNSLIDN